MADETSTTLPRNPHNNLGSFSANARVSNMFGTFANQPTSSPGPTQTAGRAQSSQPLARPTHPLFGSVGFEEKFRATSTQTTLVASSLSSPILKIESFPSSVVATPSLVPNHAVKSPLRLKDGSDNRESHALIANPVSLLPVASLPDTDSKTREFLQLVQGAPANENNGFNFATSLENEGKLQDIKTTPLFSNQVRLALTKEKMSMLGSLNQVAFPQYGLLGVRQETYGGQRLGPGTLPFEQNLVLANMNAPWSAFICGSQGGGKSHTLSCLLENSLLSSSPASVNPKPLAGLVFHYDHFTSVESTQLCEAAYLCSSGMPVRVLVSPSNYQTMRKLYSNLPGMPVNGPKPQVVPLYFKEEQLNVTRMMTLMAMNDSHSVPLYMEVLYKVLRDMAMQNNGNTGVSYGDFTSRLKNQGFTRQQNNPLNMRLQLLESFLADKVQSQASTSLLDNIFKSAKGTLTIVDLSCPFVSESDACALFTICLSIFMEHRADCGRIVALDEAHKFLTKCGEAQRLTDQLISLIRQQRHLATRIVIATQEPTISPQLLDLCNVCIVHRFNSPAWFKILKDHLAGASAYKNEENLGGQNLFEMIVALRTGEAFIFCPTALLDVCYGDIYRLQDGFIKIKIRGRCSTDGGKSIMASDQFATVHVDNQPPSSVIRPYARPTYTIPSRRTINQPSSSPPGHSMRTRSMASPSVRTQAPLAAPTSVAQPTQSYSNLSTTVPLSRREEPRFSQSTILTRIREEVNYSMRQDPTRVRFEGLRDAVVRSLNLSPAFFKKTEWVKLSRDAIHDEVAKYVTAHRLPKPVLY